MITAMHALVYSDDAAATRAFFRDVLRWPFVSDDEGCEAADWLIFRSGRSEVGVHPTRVVTGRRHGSTPSRCSATTSRRRWPSCGAAAR